MRKGGLMIWMDEQRAASRRWRIYRYTETGPHSTFLAIVERGLIYVHQAQIFRSIIIPG